MIESYGEYQKMAENASDVNGTTLKNQEKYAESLSGKLQGLSATWEKIGDEALNSGFLKFLVDIGSGLATVVEKLGLVNSALIGIGAYAGIKNFGNTQACVQF